MRKLLLCLPWVLVVTGCAGGPLHGTGTARTTTPLTTLDLSSAAAETTTLAPPPADGWHVIAECVHGYHWPRDAWTSASHTRSGWLPDIVTSETLKARLENRTDTRAKTLALVRHPHTPENGT